MILLFIWLSYRYFMSNKMRMRMIVYCIELGDCRLVVGCQSERGELERRWPIPDLDLAVKPVKYCMCIGI